MAVMVLSENNKLNVEDRIRQHLPDAPDSWNDVTIHHLLTHTSGIPSYTSMPEYRRDMMLPQTHEEMIARFQGKALEFVPGEEFRYSNSGYFLLGVIIENVSGMSYEEFLRREILDPLGLNDTGYDQYRLLLKRRANGYSRRPDGIIPARYLDMSQPYAAGSLYSTVEDLNRWDQALRRHVLISSGAYDAMFTPDLNGYAYGWHVEERKGRKMIRHGGGINGFASFILRCPDESLCVIALSNIQQSNPGRLATDLAAIVLGEKYELPTARQVAEVDPNIFDQYVGKYKLRDDLVLVISRDGDKLLAKIAGEPQTRLFPESATVYFDKITGAELRFLKEEKGRIGAVLLKQGSRETRAERID